MRPSDEVERVLALVGRGLNDCEIARRTGIPRTTVLNWRRGRDPRSATGAPGPACETCGAAAHRFDGLPDAYAYLLGLYLGDGCITRHARAVYRLNVYLDMLYPGIIQECAAAVKAVMPTNRVLLRRFIRGHRCAEVSAYSKQWPCLFPQHGPGPKHKRQIALTPWQDRIVREHPALLLRGLIHSDGCRFMNRVRRGEKRYSYPRYNFTNASDEIRRIFCDACDRLGVEWRQMNARNISVARRASVERLDGFVGPKR